MKISATKVRQLFYTTMTGFTEQLHWMDWIIENTQFDQCIMEHRKNKDGTVTHWIHVSHSLKHNRRCVISNIWKK